MSEKPEERRTRPFADFLAEHNRGAGHTKASELMQEVVGAVRDTGKKGVLTIKVMIEPLKNQEDTLLTVIEVDAKLPVNPPKAAVFYADEDNNLQRNDPNQLQFDGLREIEPQKSLRDLSDDALTAEDAR